MKKKTGQLQVVKPTAEEERERNWMADEPEFKKVEEFSRITRIKLHALVRQLRTELESYQRQIEAVPFDIPADEVPHCLDWSKRKYHVELVQSANPTLDPLFEAINDYAEKHGCHERTDFQAHLFALKSKYAATGFRVGVLAGVIFAGCPKETVDRFERGLEFALSTPYEEVLKYPLKQ